AGVARRDDSELRLCGLDVQRHVLGSQLLGAGERSRAEPPRTEEREDPLRASAHHRHHDVAALDPAPDEAGGCTLALPRDVGKRITAAASVARDRSERLAVWMLACEPADDVAGEVEAAHPARCLVNQLAAWWATASRAPRSSNRWPAPGTTTSSL